MPAFVVGGLVFLVLALIGRAFGAPILIGLMASFAFGATAIGNVGGSTVPLYVAFAAVLLLSVGLNRRFLSELRRVFETQPIATLVCLLTVYTVLGAYIFPRLFAGATNVIVAVGYRNEEIPLGPVPGNINQSAYCLLNGFVFFAICILVRQGWSSAIRIGLLVWASLHVTLGFTDMFSKMVGLGNILLPIKNASYGILDHEVGGFQRISGGFPEASAYAIVALQALAFTFVDWRYTNSRLSLVLMLALLTLAIFSTSSTAYAGLAAMGLGYILAASVLAMQRGIFRHDAVLLGLAYIGITAGMAVYFVDAERFDPIVDVILNATINKTTSESAIERGHWNSLGLKSFFDTLGLGIGLGSSRTSSWIISVLSQLGLIGTIGFMIAICLFAFRVVYPASTENGGLAASLAAAGLAGITAGSIAGSGADPGTLFYVALALVSATFSIDKRPEYEPLLRRR